LADVRWSEGDEIKTSSRFQDADMPEATADRAVATGHALPSTDPKAKGLRRGAIAAPRAEFCIDLDASDLGPMRKPMGVDLHKVEARMQEQIGGRVSQRFDDPARATQ
jgi:hypothetical protein